MLEAPHNIDDTSTLVQRAQKHPQVNELIRSLKTDKRRVDVSGLRGSSPALVIEALRLALDQQIIVCCADEEKAHDARSDLGTVSKARIQLLPEKDIFPQPFELKENLVVRGRRNACLDRVLRDEVDIVVTSLSGFLEKTTPREMLSNTQRGLTNGEQIDLDELREFLADVGYEATGTVEELGQFAVRGAIVDIFDPAWDEPVRLELLDDEIVSMRAFDIDTQRSLRSLDSVRILPAVSVPVTEESLVELEKKLHALGVATDKVSEVRHEIEHHRFSFLLRRYAPVLGMQGALLDFFDKPPLIFFWGEEQIGDALNKLDTDYEKLAKLADPEHPLLELYEYLHAPDHYAAFDVAHVHLWGFSSSAAAKKAEKEKTPRLKPPNEVVSFHTSDHPPVLGKLDPLLDLIRKLDKKGVEVHMYSGSAVQRERLADMLDEDEFLVHLPVGWITEGFLWQSAGIMILTDHQIFHRALPRPSDRRKTRRAQGYRHDHLQTGDFVVHVDYGIGRYVGLEKVAVGGGETECLSLRYDGNDRIFVPLDQMPLVEKYVGKEGAFPKLDRLGSNKWQRTKAKTRKVLEDVAQDMLRAHAERELAERPPFRPDTQWQKELEASFPFEETPHQLRTANEVKEDMESLRPMDRLVCGDVGFGKTEIALRAAFKAMNDGKQVAVLVPTTILALQHYKTFSDRMGMFPVRIEMLSRFKTTAEQKEIVAAQKAGKVDLVIGTHRLLSKDVVFHDLGLLIIDEEHRFGVKSKEKLKELKASVDVLSLTATPIPRTLYMALSGIRAISVMDTPPRNRHPVRTEVVPFDEDTIAEAITAELAREGQVFFVHNRVASIYSMQAFLQRLLPDIRMAVGHGQMGEHELEAVILDFVDKKFDVLLCTTIIESGLDFPNVNTIIINRADRFGLAELYQLRGRVGRRETQAFAHLLVPRNFSITRNASKRLQAMEEFEELGSGYRLAMRDLEIRGSGNVLGTAQHGQIAAVGFELYCKMLRDAVEALQGQQKDTRVPCKIEIRLPSFLPEAYVGDQNERMALYRQLAQLESPDDMDAIRDEIADRFGELPKEALNLIEVTRLKLWATELGIANVQFKPQRVTLDFHEGKAFVPALCAQLVETFRGRVLFKSSKKFGLDLTHPTTIRGLDEAKKLLNLAWMYGKKGTPGQGKFPAESS